MQSRLGYLLLISPFPAVDLAVSIGMQGTDTAAKAWIRHLSNGASDAPYDDSSLSLRRSLLRPSTFNGCELTIEVIGLLLGDILYTSDQKETLVCCAHAFQYVLAEIFFIRFDNY